MISGRRGHVRSTGLFGQPLAENAGVGDSRRRRAEENHPSEEAELEQLCVLFLSPSEFWDGQRRIVQGDFLAPNRGQGFEFSEETLVEIADAVRETCVVTGNAVGDELVHHRRLRAPSRILQNLSRPGRRVIDARAATKSILETLGIFAEVMQNACESGGRVRLRTFRLACRIVVRRPSDAAPRLRHLEASDTIDRMRKIRLCVGDCGSLVCQD